MPQPSSISQTQYGNSCIVQQIRTRLYQLDLTSPAGVSCDTTFIAQIPRLATRCAAVIPTRPRDNGNTQR